MNNKSSKNCIKTYCTWFINPSYSWFFYFHVYGHTKFDKKYFDVIMSKQIKLLKMHIETDMAPLDMITIAIAEITNVPI